jgi:hypothetical protein
MLYLIGLTVYESTRSLERFWSSIFDPVGILLFQGITRYWTVAEKNSLLLSWSPHIARGVFFYNRLLWLSVGLLALAAVWALFPMSVEALTAKSQGRQPCPLYTKSLALQPHGCNISRSPGCGSR